MPRLLALLVCALLSGCSSPQLDASGGFTFAHFDSVVIARPASAAEAALFGLDIQFTNLMHRCHLQVIGDKLLESLSAEARARTLVARLALTASGKRQIFSVSFDEATTGRTVASMTTEAAGDLLDADDRARTFEPVAEAIIHAVERDKGVEIDA